jgi:putative oxidoreductase
MKNPAFEQTFKSARTNLRSLLFRSQLIVGFGFIQHGHAKLARGSESFINVLHAMGVPTPLLPGRACWERCA